MAIATISDKVLFYISVIESFVEDFDKNADLRESFQDAVFEHFKENEYVELLEYNTGTLTYQETVYCFKVIYSDFFEQHRRDTMNEILKIANTFKSISTMNNEQYFNNLKGETRDKAVVKYRELLLSGECGGKVNWAEINIKIIERWSHSALDYIKFHAFCPKTPDRRIWVTAKNRNFEHGIFLVSIADFWALCRVGFANYEEANEHLENLRKPFLTPSV